MAMGSTNWIKTNEWTSEYREHKVGVCVNKCVILVNYGREWRIDIIKIHPIHVCCIYPNYSITTKNSGVRYWGKNQKFKEEAEERPADILSTFPRSKRPCIL